MRTIKKFSSEILRYSPKFILGVFIVLLIVTVGSIAARASCDIVYKPGEVLYVDAGHSVTMIVEPDKMVDYLNRKIPDQYLPLPTESGLNDLTKEGVGYHYCGEYREISDEDVYGNE